MMKTMEGMALPRCLLVGLRDEEVSICAAALTPIKLVKVDGVKEACARMSTVLPLMVVASAKFDGTLLDELRDVAETCAAEVFVLDDPAPDDAIERLFDTLRRADRRRSSPMRRED
jgi:hypothetical protein